MGNSNGVISAPVNVETDVYRVLGIGAQGGFYDIGYACSNLHGKTNPYAKFKPIIWDSPGIDLHAGTNWKGEDGLCGFNVPVYTSIGELTDGMLSGNVFTYNAPVAGKDWCRITDFIGYNHNAPKGFFTEPNLQGEVSVQEDGTVYLEVIAASSTDPLNDHISFVDLSPVNSITGSNINASDMYVGVLFYRTRTDQFVMVSSEKFGAMSDIIGFKIPIDSSRLNRQWTYYVFLCEDKDMDFNTVFLPTDIKPTRVIFIAYGTDVRAYLSIRSIDNENGSFTIVYENKGIAVSYDGATATLYDDADNELAFESISQGFTLNTNGTKTINFDFFYDFDGNQNPDIESSYRLSVKTQASTGGGYLYEEVLFERYPDGTWRQL